MTLNFQTSGLHTVTMNTIDRYDSNTYTITVDVFDAYPLYITKVDDGSGHFYVEMENTYIDQIQRQTSSSLTLHQPSRSLKPHGTSATMRRNVRWSLRGEPRYYPLVGWLVDGVGHSIHLHARPSARHLVPSTRTTTNSQSPLIPTETITRPSQA